MEPGPELDAIYYGEVLGWTINDNNRRHVPRCSTDRGLAQQALGLSDLRYECKRRRVNGKWMYICFLDTKILHNYIPNCREVDTFSTAAIVALITAKRALKGSRWEKGLEPNE